MILPIPTYITTISDLEILQKLGYEINLSITGVEFINTYLINLGILALIAENALVSLADSSIELTRTKQ